MSKRGPGPFNWRSDLPLVVLFIPFALLFGFHVALFATWLRKWTGIPYLLNMIGLYGLLLMPFWVSKSYPISLPMLAWFVTTACLIPPILVRGHREVMDGGNLESPVFAHLVLVLMYFLLPAVREAREAHTR